MRVGIVGIMAGLTMAIALKNGDNLNSQVVRASLVTEILFIIIFGLIELY